MEIDHLLSALRLYERRTPADPPLAANQGAEKRWQTESLAYGRAGAAVESPLPLNPASLVVLLLISVSDDPVEVF